MTCCLLGCFLTAILRSHQLDFALLHQITSTQSNFCLFRVPICYRPEIPELIWVSESSPDDTATQTRSPAALCVKRLSCLIGMMDEKTSGRGRLCESD